jgi:hypothetical protein
LHRTATYCQRIWAPWRDRKQSALVSACSKLLKSLLQSARQRWRARAQNVSPLHSAAVCPTVAVVGIGNIICMDTPPSAWGTITSERCGLHYAISACVRTADIPAGQAGAPESQAGNFWNFRCGLVALSSRSLLAIFQFPFRRGRDRSICDGDRFAESIRCIGAAF